MANSRLHDQRWPTSVPMDSNELYQNNVNRLKPILFSFIEVKLQCLYVIELESNKTVWNPNVVIKRENIWQNENLGPSLQKCTARFGICDKLYPYHFNSPILISSTYEIYYWNTNGYAVTVWLFTDFIDSFFGCWQYNRSSPKSYSELLSQQNLSCLYQLCSAL